ncbi:MAG: DUF2007 domain-containing protein [Lachnospiraceae bacterium]|nr:DUF2007 domain-containing protein [Lachnospiraceae bacterium]
MEAMNPVKIYSAPDKITAEMLLELLKNNEIPAYKQGRGSGGYMDIYAGNSLFGEDIYVDKDDAARASRLIQEVTAEAEPLDEIFQEDETAPSPSTTRTPMSRRRLFSIILLVFMAISGIFGVVMHYILR